MYDMMVFALKYRNPIDAITAEQEFKLRKHELYDEDWKIVGDLVAVLEVCVQSPSVCAILTYLSNIKRPRFFSQVIRQQLLQSYLQWID